MTDPVTAVTPTGTATAAPAAAPEGDLAGLAAETVRESAAAVVRPEGAAGAVPAGPVDRWGRAFDPLLHKVKTDGTPQLRDGVTLILKNKAARPLTSALPRAARATAGSDFLDTEAAGLNAGLEGHAEGVASEGLPDVPAAELPVTPAEAELDAQAIADGLEMLGQGVSGEPESGAMKETERTAVETRWKNVLLRYNLRLPIGQLLLAGIATVKYGVRVAVLPKTQERTETFLDWILGRPRRHAPTAAAPQQQQQGQPAQAPRGTRQIAEDTGL
jgi:hypothetical protein